MYCNVVACVPFKATLKTGLLRCDGVAVWLGKREAVTVGGVGEGSCLYSRA